MLQVKNISKKYVTGGLTQTALDDVSLTLRDNEFVAILGPSGSGKTTLLNVIGGLDRYDSGDLIINGISTKKYTDRDWDSYRNHTIGFVFQSYNLIPHQSILSNVELALTISGVSKSERKRRAAEALEKVGLGDQLHKRPNQMSGGQMQRVAIARALINDPDILLADEPTGALDSDTSLQVMELLKEVAADRLVVMVTHNPELAEQYSNRIISLKDGRITGDTNPYTTKNSEASHKNLGRASMSLLTALSLSFNNLRTKKGRTILTAFAGSIGIIGIALILALSNGVNGYIRSIQEETMASYPITIEEQAFDISSLISVRNDSVKGMTKDADHELDAVYADAYEYNMRSSLTTSLSQNNLTAFKQYLDDETSEIHKYLGKNGISYTYNTSFNVYAYDPDGILVSTDGVKIKEKTNAVTGMMGMNSNLSSAMMSSFSRSTSVFYEMLSGPDGLASDAIKSSNDLLAGTWPTSFNEVVLCLNKRNEVALTYLYDLGLLPSSEYEDTQKRADAGETIAVDDINFSYEDIIGKELYLIPACDLYKENAQGNYDYIGGSSRELEQSIDKALTLKITGVIRAKEDAAVAFSQPIGYTSALTDWIIDYTNNSNIVNKQKENAETNILNGLMFSAASDEDKITDAKQFIANLNTSEKASMMKDFQEYIELMNQSGMLDNLSGADLSGYTGLIPDTLPVVTEITDASEYEGTEGVDSSALEGMNGIDPSAFEGMEGIDSSAFGGMEGIDSSAFEGMEGIDSSAFGGMEGIDSSAFEGMEGIDSSAFEGMEGIDPSAFQGMEGLASGTLPTDFSSLSEPEAAAYFDYFIASAEDSVLIGIYDKYVSNGTYDDNMKSLGVISKSAPSKINIYADTFEAKDKISECITAYNEKAEENDKITYTDYVALLMSSITTIIDVITYVLIAFVSVSLIVSSIMIGIITYISVLERTKEIGILRAIGASKRNVSRVFNAETFIIGLISGLLGVGISELMLLPANAVIHSLAGTDSINAVLSLSNAVILILLSMILTLIGGLIPSRKAAKKDPVAALRTE